MPHFGHCAEPDAVANTINRARQLGHSTGLRSPVPPPALIVISSLQETAQTNRTDRFSFPRRATPRPWVTRPVFTRGTTCCNRSPAITPAPPGESRDPPLRPVTEASRQRPSMSRDSNAKAPRYNVRPVTCRRYARLGRHCSRGLLARVWGQTRLRGCGYLGRPNAELPNSKSHRSRHSSRTSADNSA